VRRLSCANGSRWGEERECAILVLGGVRMLLFEAVVFENLVSGGVWPGLTHAVYEVDELDAEYACIRALGAEVHVEPTEVSAAFGERRLAFFRSPSGFVFEVVQVLERKISNSCWTRHCRSASRSEVGADFKQDVWLVARTTPPRIAEFIWPRHIETYDRNDRSDRGKGPLQTGALCGPMARSSLS
jgi:hypothetical protein